MKIGIIRCDTRSADCAGWHCFPAMRDRTGAARSIVSLSSRACPELAEGETERDLASLPPNLLYYPHTV
jgi:hypothetical protein